MTSFDCWSSIDLRMSLTSYGLMTMSSGYLSSGYCLKTSNSMSWEELLLCELELLVDELDDRLLLD